MKSLSFIIVILSCGLILWYLKRVLSKIPIKDRLTLSKLIFLTVPSLVMFIEPLTKVTLGHPDNHSSLTILQEMKFGNSTSTPPGILYLYQYFEQISFGSLNTLYIIALVNMFIYLSLITTIFDYYGFRTAFIFSLLFSSSLNYIFNTELRQTLNQNFAVFVVIFILIINFLLNSPPTTKLIIFSLLGFFQVYVITIMYVNIVIVESIRSKNLGFLRKKIEFVLAPIIIYSVFLINMAKGFDGQRLINTALIPVLSETESFTMQNQDVPNIETMSNPKEISAQLWDLFKETLKSLIIFDFNFNIISIVILSISIFIMFFIKYEKTNEIRDTISYLNYYIFLICFQNITGLLELEYFQGRMMYQVIIIFFLILTFYIMRAKNSMILVLTLFIFSNIVYPQSYERFYDENKIKDIYNIIRFTESNVCVSDITNINFVGIQTAWLNYENIIDFKKIQCKVFIINQGDNLLDYYNYLFKKNQISESELIYRMKLKNEIQIRLLKNKYSIYDYSEINKRIKVLEL